MSGEYQEISSKLENADNHLTMAHTEVTDISCLVAWVHDFEVLENLVLRQYILLQMSLVPLEQLHALTRKKHHFSFRNFECFACNEFGFSGAVLPPPGHT